MTYDALGNKRTEAATIPAPGGSPLGNASHGLTYGYDDANALASANRDVMVSETSVVIGSGGGGYNTLYNHSGASGYAYDVAYNPTLFSFWNGSADAVASYPVNADNQVAITGINFDGNGNPTTYMASALAFDPEERLVSVPAMTGGNLTAAYDGDGLRATKTVIPVGGSAAVTTYFLYDGGHLLLEETWNGTAASLANVNGWAADGLRARLENGVAYDFAYDPQGNLIQRQSAGAYTVGYAAYDQAIYEGYGALRQDVKLTASKTGGAATTPRDPVGFGGQFGYYTDTETGLLCLTHRYYDPGTGKFLNRDPIGYQGGANLYGFCEGNPVNGSDPLGLWNIYKAIYTGDGDASDAVYDAAVAQGAATLTFEGRTMLNLNKKSLVAVGAAFGIGTAPIWPMRKRPEEMRPGSRPYTSVMRRVNDALQRRAQSGRFKDGKVSKNLRSKALNEAKYLKSLLKGGVKGRMLRTQRISRIGLTVATLRWGAVGVLYYEAGLSAYTGYEAMQQPLIDDETGQ